MAQDTPQIRLQVYLSRNGFCSRREAMDVVKSGRVSVNGQVISEPSTPVNPGRDHVMVDGWQLKAQQYEYVMLNKPKGVTTTCLDPFASKTVLDLLPPRWRHLKPVGRLDKDTEGLLLFTNDGDLAQKLTHPRHHIDKTYFVKVKGELTQPECKQLEGGINLQGYRTSPAKIHILSRNRYDTVLTMTIHEGRKRQIRLMMAKVKHPVIYLKRQSLGPLRLGELRSGMSRPLSAPEVTSLQKIL